MTTDTLYFAYGSNLSRPQMLKRCPGASPLDVAVLRGYRLAFTRYSSGWEGGVADVVPDDASSVWGLLYALTVHDLDELDRYEGYPDAYNRFQASVEGPAGLVSGVWIYTVVRKAGFVPPRREYLDDMRSAAEELGFPAEYLRVLKSFSATDP